MNDELRSELLERADRDQAAHAALLLVQHAPLDLREQCLPLLEAGRGDPARGMWPT